MPSDVLERFPSLGTWSRDINRFWSQNTNALQDFARAAMDETEIGGVLNIDGASGALYVRETRGMGKWSDANTAFYVDQKGFFSLKDRLTWNPDTNVLTVEGTIIATGGTIGGFDIGADYIRDVANTFGLASTVTGGNDVRFWAGDTFANRATAPFRIYENGNITVGAGASYQYNDVPMISGISALNNWFFGNSGNFTMTGDQNASFGTAALMSNTTGFDNMAFGYEALTVNTTGNMNTAFGKAALKNNTIGFQNQAFGTLALTANIDGDRNTGIGAYTLFANLSGNNNVAVGHEALISCTGSFNTGVGMDVLLNLSAGSSNSAFGYNTGLGITTGTNNTILGAGVAGLAAGLTGHIILAIGDGTIKARYNGTSWALTGGIDSTAIGGVTPAAGAFTTISASGVITSTLATGTAPLTVASTTVVGNLNVSQLLGATWAIPGAIGATTPNSGAFTTITATGDITGANLIAPTFVTTQFDVAASTVFADVTGLSVNVVAGKTYSFRSVLFVTADGTGDSKVAAAGTCTVSAFIASAMVELSAGTVSEGRTTTKGAQIFTSDATTISYVISGTAVVSGSGTLTIQFAQSVANGTSSVLVGSSFQVWS